MNYLICPIRLIALLILNSNANLQTLLAKTFFYVSLVKPKLTQNNP